MSSGTDLKGHVVVMRCLGIKGHFRCIKNCDFWEVRETTLFLHLFLGLTNLYFAYRDFGVISDILTIKIVKIDFLKIVCPGILKLIFRGLNEIGHILWLLFKRFLLTFGLSLTGNSVFYFYGCLQKHQIEDFLTSKEFYRKKV